MLSQISDDNEEYGEEVDNIPESIFDDDIADILS